MSTQTYTKNIREVIKSQLLVARFDIYVAVAWFTDKILFDLLIEKAKQGVKVRIVLLKDLINSKASFDHRDIENIKGDCYFRDHHNKFCVIDRQVVITGSCNWTPTAFYSNNRENIVVISDKMEGENYANTFLELIKKPVEVQEYDFSDDYKLKFLGSFKRVIDDFEEQGFGFHKPIGVDVRDLWKQRNWTPFFVSKENQDEKIRIDITPELRTNFNSERDNILSLPMYKIMHRSGNNWTGCLILGLESDNEKRFDPTNCL